MIQLNHNSITERKQYPIKVLQFGEGNFLRAFVDWMIQKANDAKILDMGIVIVQPLENGIVHLLKKQDCIYHVLLEGIKDGQPIREKQRIDCVMDAVNPYNEYQTYEEYFLSPELEIIISNTTEAGIAWLEHENLNAQPPLSFPGKVTALLHKRFVKFNGDATKGLDFVCCELIENNASELKKIVLALAEKNNLGSDFIHWMHEACTFNNSLVDRIVTGFPKDTIAEVQTELGFEDNLVVVGEYFHLWAIEGAASVKEKFDLQKAGLNVIWLDDMKAFRDKKVRVLNGSHTALVPLGLLSKYATVKDAFANSTISNFIKEMVSLEILPTIKGEQKEKQIFADEILERFLNPYIRHYLKDISLNSISKWMTRDYPSLIDTINQTGSIPLRLSFSLAALIALYKPNQLDTFVPNDDAASLQLIASIWNQNTGNADAIRQILSSEQIWGVNLSIINGLTDVITAYFELIVEQGIVSALEMIHVKVVN